ncbi:endonuclease/exonuclease/phosphatase family protein [Paenactinomyces guangxiensis]|nr:endonuclease/exonuclease/phosphatase family protein [Paenactinomyces guangxiensis]
MIKVLTFNIHHGRGTDRQKNIDRTLQVLKESDADLIGLNEVDKHFSKRSYHEDQISWLAHHLQMYHAFGPTLTLKSRRYNRIRQFGNAFLSRYPIVSQTNHRLHFYGGKIGGRGLLEMSVHVHHQPVQVYVTHLSLNPFLHHKQTNFIIGQLMNHHQPVILLGDWNMKPHSRGWKKLTQYLTDASTVSERKRSYTFPSFHPKTQLDYIFTSHHFQVASTKVIKKIPAASDHLPLMATLVLNWN